VKLHHLGAVVDSFKEPGELYAKQFRMHGLGPAVHDSLQRVIFQFWHKSGAVPVLNSLSQ
jgi:hypothetical protein